MKEGSTTEMKQQVAKSQALVREASITNAAIPTKEPKNSVLPYVIGGFLLVAGVRAVVI